jgi:hypothetical protein
MTNDSLIVRNGVVIINNRAFKAAPDYSIPNRFKVSVDTVDVTYTQTALTTLLPIQGTELIDDCSVVTGWTTTGGTVTVNSTTFKADGGTDGALNLTKTGTASATVSTTKATTSRDGTSKDFLAWFYIKDSTAMSYLSQTGTAVSIRIGSDSTNYYITSPSTASFTTGWNYIKKAIPTDFTTVGAPAIAALDYTDVSFVTTATTLTTAEGDFIFDALRVASTDDYYKTVDSISFDETDGSVTVVSKLAVTEANGFLIDGHALFNTDAGTAELMFAKSKFTSNSKGTSDLFKITNKFKVRNNNQ